MPSAVDPAAGYPSFDELLEAYAERAGIEVPDLRWYRAFAAYKLAVILEGIHFRYQAGDTVGKVAKQYGTTIDAIARASKLADPNFIHIGDELTVPVNCATPSPTPGG